MRERYPALFYSGEGDKGGYGGGVYSRSIITHLTLQRDYLDVLRSIVKLFQLLRMESGRECRSRRCLQGSRRYFILSLWRVACPHGPPENEIRQLDAVTPDDVWKKGPYVWERSRALSIALFANFSRDAFAS